MGQGTQAGAAARTMFGRWGDGGRGTGAVLECGATGGVRRQHIQIAGWRDGLYVQEKFACASANDIARALIAVSLLVGRPHARMRVG